MQRVVAYLDTPGDEKFLDAEDALQDTTGYGGRIEPDKFRFAYITRDGLSKWELPVREAAIRDIADGLLIEIMGVRFDIVRTKQRQPSGEPLLVWGEYVDDALAIRDDEQFLVAIDGLQTASFDAPRMLRVWSAMDDQCVAVIKGDACALYVVESVDGYGTSTGDLSRNESFEIADQEGKPMTVPWADCIPWGVARLALAHFMRHGELGQSVLLEGRIPSLLLMMGDIDRKAALATRGEAPSELKRTSLPRMSTPIPAEIIATDELTAPHDVEAPLKMEELSAWARRLIEVLYTRELIEIGNSNLDEITYQLGGLLQAHGTEAQDSVDTAEWLANEIGAVRGITRLFATGGDLQIALRRSREA
ncbi:MAG: hypothetical protein M4D80_39155 [Myxococcota bacterium]|nr:hypothetical protein [Myxococcota bacterium]